MASIKLSIAEPCHENWDAMLPEDKGRFCLSCQKTVVDFTAMNDRQVFDYFKNYQGNTCGQFSNQQLGRELTKPKTHSIGRWKYFWQLLLPAFFAFQKVQAQPKQMGKVAVKPTCKVDKKKPDVIRMGLVAPQHVTKPVTLPGKLIEGKIVNEKNEPLPFASIASTDGKFTTADSSGKFKMLLNDNATLTISQVGYQQKTFTIDSIQTNNISALKFDNGNIVIETTIELNYEVALMGEVVITGYTSVKKSNANGTTSMVQSNQLAKQKTAAPVILQPQLKIFPNPIQPTQNFQIAFTVKKTGNYMLRIADAAGRIVVEEKLNMLNKVQTETINGTALQQAGIYFITLTNPADKKGNALSGRVVVQ